MRFEFKLPDIGEGMVEGEIVKWHVKAGDEINEDVPMLDVMTDKATVTIPSPKSGKVTEVHGKEGEVVKVGAVLVVIETAGGSASPSVEARVTGHNGERKPTLLREEPKRAVALETAGATKALASPATRRLAREQGVDLNRVSGTGPGGRVTQDDIRLMLEGGVSKVAVKIGGEERIPLKGLRRKIAEKMTISKTRIPHFTYVEEADVTELMTLRDRAEQAASQKGIRLTYLPFIIKMTVRALQEFPRLNAMLDEAKQEVVLKKYYHIGIAASTPEGLTVPVLKDADQKSILQIAREVNQLGEKARSGKLSLDELQGSTFTITSLGAQGGAFATPIINYPEVAILGIHRIQERPVVRNKQIVIRNMMYVSLSFDHRVIDGDVGARFANRIIEFMQSPGLLLMD